MGVHRAVPRWLGVATLRPSLRGTEARAGQQSVPGVNRPNVPDGRHDRGEQVSVDVGGQRILPEGVCELLTDGHAVTIRVLTRPLIIHGYH